MTNKLIVKDFKCIIRGKMYLFEANTANSESEKPCKATIALVTTRTDRSGILKALKSRCQEIIEANKMRKNSIHSDFSKYVLPRIETLEIKQMICDARSKWRKEKRDQLRKAYPTLPAPVEVPRPKN